MGVMRQDENGNWVPAVGVEPSPRVWDHYWVAYSNGKPVSEGIMVGFRGWSYRFFTRLFRGWKWYRV